MKFLLLLFALCPLLALAEDVRFANGTTMRGVTVLNIHPDGIVIQPPGFGATATKYPWSYIHPADVPSLKTRGEKDARRAEALSKLEATAGTYSIVISQVLDGGALADVSIQRNNYSLPTPEGQVQSGRVFIHLRATNGIYDGARVTQKLYFAGTYRYETVLGAPKTVPALATSLDDAVAAIKGSAAK